MRRSPFFLEQILDLFKLEGGTTVTYRLTSLGIEERMPMDTPKMSCFVVTQALEFNFCRLVLAACVDYHPMRRMMVTRNLIHLPKLCFRILFMSSSRNGTTILPCYVSVPSR